MPHNLWGLCLLRPTRRFILNTMVGTIALNYNGDLISMILHDLFTLLILLDRNIRVQYIIYTSECIPKLQIYQHSLLTRKVFSRHNLSAQVFFSVSSGSSSSPHHLQVIFIFKSSSSSSYLHLKVIFIIGYGSLLDVDHH